MYFDELPVSIRIFGIGNAGGMALQHMINSGLEDAEHGEVSFIYADTDAQALACSGAGHKILLGKELLHGCGTESRPELGTKAAEESLDVIREAIGDADLLFLVAGMGGGTGTGAIPVIARAANELGVLTVCVITKPFHIEGAKPMQIALQGISELLLHENCLITISNDRLPLDSPSSEHADLLKKADEAMCSAVCGISDLITKSGVITADFADIRTVISKPGLAFMGKGIASGQNRALHAARKALSSPLLENIAVSDAHAILVNITAAGDVGLDEFCCAAGFICDAAESLKGKEQELITALSLDEHCGDEMRITVIAIGFNSTFSKQTEAVPQIGSGPCQGDR